MTLKWTPEGYLEYGIGCLSDPKKTKEKGSTNGSTFTPLYNGIEDSYGVDSIGSLEFPRGIQLSLGTLIHIRYTSYYNVSDCYI